jgi:hypothetical protein
VRPRSRAARIAAGPTRRVRRESFDIVSSIGATGAQCRPGVRRGIMSRMTCMEAWRCSADRDETSKIREEEVPVEHQEHPHRDGVRIVLAGHDLGEGLGQCAAEAVVEVENGAHQPVAEARMLGRPADEAVDVGPMLRDERLVELDLLAQALLGAGATRGRGRGRRGTARTSG